MIRIIQPRLCMSILVAVWAVFAQHSNDSLLFSIPLTEDSSSLFFCDWDGEIRNTLSGPILMRDKTLLFYSVRGYALFTVSGKQIDEHSLVRKNERLARENKPLTHLAYPLDNTDLLYYRESETPDRAPKLFRKRFERRWIRPLSEPDSEVFGDVRRSVLFNLAGNTITNEMSVKSFLKPHLAGYRSLNGGTKWWCLDKFYSFRSPIVVEKNGSFLSCYTGLKADAETGVKHTLIEPVGVSSFGGRFYYYGVYNPGGSDAAAYYQRLFLCDEAGNLLYSNSILKDTVVDAVVGENEKEKMLYTAKRSGRHVFLPSVDRRGAIYYGVIDYENKRIDVMRRPFYGYVADPCAISLAEKIDYESGISTELEVIEFEQSDNHTLELPRIAHTSADGKSRYLSEAELTTEGYVVKIARRVEEKLKQTLPRIHHTLPEHVQHMQDSLSQQVTAWRPFILSIRKGDKELRTFYYGIGDMVLAGRVLGVTDSGKVIVRVDLQKWAEILVFDRDGGFLNRFVFNRQHVIHRSDLIVVAHDGQIVEKDFEAAEDGYRFLSWRLEAQL